MKLFVFQVEKDDTEKVENENEEKLEESQQQQQQQRQQQATAHRSLSHPQPNSDQEMIIAEIAPHSATSDETSPSANVSSALPTTVIMTQRHRMITTAGQIR